MKLSVMLAACYIAASYIAAHTNYIYTTLLEGVDKLMTHQKGAHLKAKLLP